jgi:aminoglycoside phosphotransferase (APT) family kinase protein
LKVLDAGRELLREHLANPFLKQEDLSLLQALIHQCSFLEAHWIELEELCLATPRALVHGDLVSKNVRVRGATSDELVFFAFDWENAGWGVPAADLASFPDRTVNPDLEVYGACFKNGLSAKSLAECGRIFRLLESIRWAASCLALKPYDSWLARPIASLQVYRHRMAEAFAERQWDCHS